jgi:hypothetical protein
MENAHIDPPVSDYMFQHRNLNPTQALDHVTQHRFCSQAQFHLRFARRLTKNRQLLPRVQKRTLPRGGTFHQIASQ